MYNETACMSTSKLMQAVFVLHMPGTCRTLCTRIIE